MKGNFFKKKGTIACAASLISIIIGIVFGFLLLLAFNSSEAAGGLIKILTTGVANSEKFAKVLYSAAPLLMTGLAVAFAFKTGLFNIGATGQYTIGMFFSLTAAIQFQQPWYVAIFFGMIGGAIWGAIPGLFKAYFNVNEVITSIMFNWIGMYSVNLLLANMPMMLANYWTPAPYNNRTAALASCNPSAILPKLGLDQVLNSSYMNIGIFIAIIFAVIVWVIVNKTTFGFELRACGLNRNASVYAGINAKRNIVLSMMISGALAGIGGSLYYLSGTVQYVTEKILLDMGFNGIPVALLASSHPIGTIFGALFVSYIQVGGEALQPKFAPEVIDIIIAAIIYLSAFSLLIRELISRVLLRRNDDKSAESVEPTPVLKQQGGVDK